MNKKVSIKDIAHAVGVSTALVSYVLNGKEKEARVGKEIAEVIRATAESMNYQPNQLARSLKSGKSNTIGLIVADISNPFFSSIARTIEDEAKKNNYTVIFGSSDENAEKCWDLINVLIKRQVDGFIIAPTENSQKQIMYLEEQKVPFVLIDRYFTDIQTNFVATDNFQASYDAVNHLISTGHRSVGMIAYKGTLVHMQERKRGYLQALKENNLLPPNPLIKEVRFDRLKEDIDEGMSDLLLGRPAADSIFFATNTLALNALKYLNLHNYRVPEDLAVVSFDEGEAFDFFYSPLTFVNQPLVEVGKEAVRILINEINTREKNKKQVFINSSLVVRKSSGA